MERHKISNLSNALDLETGSVENTKQLGFMKNYVDMNVVVQSFMSLIVNFVGLFVCGNIYANTLAHEQLAMYPMVFIYTCIMGYTGITLNIFTIQIHKYKMSLTHYDYTIRTFYDSTVLLLVSLGFGWIVGFISSFFMMFNGNNDFMFLAFKNAVVSAFTCFMCTFVFVSFLLIILYATDAMHLDARNIVIPLISAICDVLFLQSMRNTIIFYHDADLPLVLMVFAFVVLAAILFLYFALNSFNTFANASYDVQNLIGFTATTLSSFVCGIIIDKLSTKYKDIPHVYPFFSGMTLSISLIYWHKNYNNMLSNKKATTNTLTMISVALSIIYVMLNNAGMVFNILFVGFFVALTGGLMKLINTINNEGNYTGETFALPLLTIIADTSTIFILVAIELVRKIFIE